MQRHGQQATAAGIVDQRGMRSSKVCRGLLVSMIVISSAGVRITAQLRDQRQPREIGETARGSAAPSP